MSRQQVDPEPYQLTNQRRVRAYPPIEARPEATRYRRGRGWDYGSAYRMRSSREPGDQVFPVFAIFIPLNSHSSFNSQSLLASSA